MKQHIETGDGDRGVGDGGVASAKDLAANINDTRQLAEILNNHFPEIIRQDCTAFIQVAYRTGLINGNCPPGSSQVEALEIIRAVINADARRRRE